MKKTDPVVVVVEDDPEWRHELGMMYTRILSGPKETTSTTYHQLIKFFATAQEAISYISRRTGERDKSKPKVDVLSLDLNLKPRNGDGMDVLNAAVDAGERFVTIAVSGFASDEEYQSRSDNKKLRELESNIVNKTKRQCVVHHKLNPNFGTVAEQVASLERLLRSKVTVHGSGLVCTRN